MKPFSVFQIHSFSLETGTGCLIYACFFDGAGGSAQSVHLIRQIQAAKRKAESAIASGSRASIEKKLQKYLAVEGDGPDQKVVIRYDSWDAAMSAKGFHSMAVSEGIGSSLASRLHGMRDTSETQYSILKSQGGQSTTSIHRTEAIYSKFAAAFISNLIRHEIESACKKQGLDTNPTIQGLRQVALLYSDNENYEAVRNLSTDQKALLGMFGIDQDDIERLAREYNERGSSINNPDRSIPDQKGPLFQSNTHKRGRPSLNNKEKEVPNDVQKALQDEAPARFERGQAKWLQGLKTT